MNNSECVGTSSCDLGGSCERHSECTTFTNCGDSGKRPEATPEAFLDLEGLKAELRRQQADATGSSNARRITTSHTRNQEEAPIS
jgi:hypothetical protein